MMPWGKEDVGKSGDCRKEEDENDGRTTAEVERRATRLVQGEGRKPRDVTAEIQMRASAQARARV